jgi:hypothetical protein
LVSLSALAQRLATILIHVYVRLAGVGNANIMEEEFDTSFLNPEKLKQSEDKLKNGEITCNIDSPEDCESCSG